MKLSTSWFLLVAFGIAFLIRAVWILSTDTAVAPFSDSQFYDAVARSLVEGRGYSVEMDWSSGWQPGGAATAFFPPGYSFFLALVYAVFGTTDEAAKWANALLGSLTVLPCYYVASRLVNLPAARLAALLAGVLPVFVIPTPVVLSEPLFGFLIASVIALVLSDDRRLVLLAGLLLGIAVLVRPMAALLVPALGLWWLWSGRSISEAAPRVAVLTGLCLLVVSPWFVRNLVVLEQPVIVSTNFGYNLRVGHAPYSNGTHRSPPDLWAARRTTFQEQELEVFQTQATRDALRYASAHPGDEVLLSVKKVLWQWAPDGAAVSWASTWKVDTRLPASKVNLFMLQVVAHAALLLLVVRGALERENGLAMKFSLVLALVWTAGHVPFFGMARFNTPVLMLFLPLAAAGLLALVPARRQPAPSQATPQAS